MRPEDPETTLRTYLAAHRIPEHLHGGLARYLLDGIRPGGYLWAVVTNNLRDAIHNAGANVSPEDTANLVRFLTMNAPAPAWGTVELALGWLALKDWRPPMPYDGCPQDHGGER